MIELVVVGIRGDDGSTWVGDAARCTGCGELMLALDADDARRLGVRHTCD